MIDKWTFFFFVFLSNLVPSDYWFWLAFSLTGNVDILARLHFQVPWSICENRRY